jgi:hypothetical protein
MMTPKEFQHLIDEAFAASGELEEARKACDRTEGTLRDAIQQRRPLPEAWEALMAARDTRLQAQKKRDTAWDAVSKAEQPQ